MFDRLPILSYLACHPKGIYYYYYYYYYYYAIWMSLIAGLFFQVLLLNQW